MKKTIIIGLGTALLLAVFISPFASSSPDGLERVAEDKHFSDQASKYSPVHSPLPDYNVPFIKNELLSTAVSGLLGTIIVFLVIYPLGKLLQEKSKGDLSN